MFSVLVWKRSSAILGWIQRDDTQYISTLGNVLERVNPAHVFQKLLTNMYLYIIRRFLG